MAGKPSYAQAAAISDVVRSRVPRAEALLTASIARDIHRRRFAAIVFDEGTDYRGFPGDLDRYYVRVPAPVLGPGEPGLRPVTDIPVRPRDWWVPRVDTQR
jgi:hypothetical protein